MAESDQETWVELLHKNPDHAFFALAHELLGHITVIYGTAQLLTIELKHPEALALENIETLKKLNSDILNSSQRAANVLTELRTELREQSSKDE